MVSRRFGFRELGPRLAKAIIESVILAVTSISPYKCDGLASFNTVDAAATSHDCRAAAAWVVAVFAFDYLISQIKVRSKPPRMYASLPSHTASHRIDTMPPAFLHALCASLTLLMLCVQCSCGLLRQQQQELQGRDARANVVCVILARSSRDPFRASSMWSTPCVCAPPFGGGTCQKSRISAIWPLKTRIFFWPRRGDGHRACDSPCENAIYQKTHPFLAPFRSPTPRYPCKMARATARVSCALEIHSH